MAPKSKVELFAAIRRDSRIEDLSIHALAERYGVHRRLVREALASAWPAPRRRPPPRKSRLDPFKPAIDRMLVADLDAPRKQRHTVQRIFDRLMAEHEMEGVSYSTVCDYVHWRRPEVRVEAGRGPPAVFIRQTHLPGVEAEVDFGDVAVRIAGESVLCYLFVFRMSYSGKAIHRISASCGMEAFFEGHVHAFNTLGGLPTGKVRYDNLSSAVKQVVGLTRARVEAERWVAFRSHFGLDVFYCQPGEAGAHEKGGVEGEVGRFRRNRLVPVPEVASLAELNAMIERWDIEDEARRIGSQLRTVGENFATEAPLLKPLPDEPFETGRLFTPRVDRYSQITVRQCHYSVPVRLIGRTVRVILHASELVVFDGRREVARHERVTTRYGSRLVLDHYLEALVRKPGALPGATALEQARAAGGFTAAHEAWWAAARRAYGDAAGTRALIEVLLLHRTLAREHVVAGITAALTVGALTADAVAVEARKAADTTSSQAPAPLGPVPQVASLTARRLAALPPDTRPLPSVAAYDQLLRHRPERRTGTEGEIP